MIHVNMAIIKSITTHRHENIIDIQPDSRYARITISSLNIYLPLRT